MSYVPRGQSVQIVDGAHHVPRLRAAQSPRRRSHIIVPHPVLYSQIRFPPEYPDGFTTFTPSIATTTVPTHRRNRPIICLVQLKIASDAPRLLGFAT